MSNTPHFLNVSPGPYVHIALLKADNAACNKTQYHYNTKRFLRNVQPLQKKKERKRSTTGGVHPMIPPYR